MISMMNVSVDTDENLTMTEEKTFLRLKRIPFSDMLKKIDGLSAEEWAELSMSTESQLNYFKMFGWTVDEYTIHWKQWIQNGR